MLTEEAKELRRAYKRQWNHSHPESVRSSQERYWNRRAAELQAEADRQEEKEHEHH